MFKIQEVSNHEVFFGSKNYKRLIPDLKDKELEIFVKGNKRNKWNRLSFDWIISNEIDDIQIKKIDVKPGIDKLKAARHFKAVLSTVDIPIEEKRIYLAYFLDQWFLNIEYEVLNGGVYTYRIAKG